jgi:mannitol-1-phosphate/altronate dehydrogenase
MDRMKEMMAAQTDWDHAAFATAAWFNYLKGADQNGGTFDINDSRADEQGLPQIARNSNGNPAPVMAASGLVETALQGNNEFMAKVSRYYKAMQISSMQDAIGLIGQEADGQRRLALVVTPPQRRANFG